MAPTASLECSATNFLKLCPPRPQLRAEMPSSPHTKDSLYLLSLGNLLPFLKTGWPRTINLTLE